MLVKNIFAFSPESCSIWKILPWPLHFLRRRRGKDRYQQRIKTSTDRHNRLIGTVPLAQNMNPRITILLQITSGNTAEQLWAGS